MSLKVSLLMEPVEQAHKVTNLALHMALEAQLRGYTVFHHTIDDLTYDAGNLYATARPLTLEEGFAHHRFGPARRIRLNDMDVALFMIEKMPFDMPFLTVTHLLDMLGHDTLVVNDPRAIRDAANKILTLSFEDLSPEMIVTSAVSDIHAFRQKVGEVVIKPLYGMHGEGIYRIPPEMDNQAVLSLTEELGQIYPGPWMVQRFIPDIVKGDKRLYLVDGEYVGGLNRVPPAGEFKATTYTGGKTEPVVLTDKDKEICRIVGAEMKRRGIIFAGLDVIGGYLTEVNTGCPGGIGYINQYCDTNIQAKGWDVIEKRLSAIKGQPVKACG